MKKFSEASKDEMIKAERYLLALKKWVKEGDIDYKVVIIADMLEGCLEHIKSEVINNYEAESK